jgi:Methyltransferase domain
MTLSLTQCPACGGRYKERYRHTERFDPLYPSYGVAETNCLLESVVLRNLIERSLMQCETCGLCFVSPSFDADELARLYARGTMRSHYARVATFTNDPNMQFDDPLPLWKAEDRHSKFVFDRVRQFTGDLRGRVVVDVGGHHGAHLRYFMEDGARGFVQDVTEQPILYPGVEYRATLKETGPIDVAILTHVLEHIVNLKVFVDQLAHAQAKGALCYVEIPYELDARLRHRDFGTPFHVNFFSKDSLVNLMRSAGYVEHQVALSRLTYGGHAILAIYGVFERTEPAEMGRGLCAPLEIVRGATYRIADRFFPRVIQFRA